MKFCHSQINGGTGEHHLKVKLATFRKTKFACFLSYVEDRANTSIKIILYTYKYIQNMFPKVGLLQKTEEGGKEDNNDI
jgi:hypothetical protein